MFLILTYKRIFLIDFLKDIFSGMSVKDFNFPGNIRWIFRGEVLSAPEIFLAETTLIDMYSCTLPNGVQGRST